MIFGFLLPRVLSVVGIKDLPQGTIQGIFHCRLYWKANSYHRKCTKTMTCVCAICGKKIEKSL
jgi:hypothetical protein